MSIQVGDTVRFTEVHETEFFLVLADSTGEVVETEGHLSIRMHDEIVGCEEWGNCVNFLPEDDSAPIAVV